ncbi:hypothetical protein KIN20_034861 [Parelaphostrongylus tenuis]|uniref:Uncharacterized protein n=1 Tax=Parelaphostrongylus tenuis TaxID=148309 RepID=A0AAD5RAZ1_PARTN|nr:hypothetical protein KIN20_034861 [Parelaphostrongylus tenuis]
MNIDSFEHPITRIGRLWLKRCGSMATLTIMVAYALTQAITKTKLKHLIQNSKHAKPS